MLPYPMNSIESKKLDEFGHMFRSSTPVRHLVIDNFLAQDVARQLLDDFPKPNDMPKSRDYVFSDKRELSTLDRHSTASRDLHKAITSEEFVGFIDPEYVGGGFHAGPPGSFLDLHCDFNIHPAHPNWLRELNILIYLNPDWQESWKGQLILTDDPSREGIEVEPLFNRLVVMESTDRSFHGYHKLNFPAGTARRSIASYAYSLIEEGAIARRTTHWVPEDASGVKKVMAKNWNWMVLTKNKFFGSATLKNRR
jgi:Rps23 Pro-64 3,4-dihydroxylase Tpa1-like proline 4-hydroxylase